MGVIRNCEKCDFNSMCETKDSKNCPFDDIRVFIGEPFYEENREDKM